MESTDRALRPSERPSTEKRTREQYDAERSAATRGRILDAAFRCLVERGYAHTSTVDICQRAGVPRGTMLHHFPSKSRLTVALLEHVFERRLNALERELGEAQRSEITLGERVDATIDVLWRIVGHGGTTIAWLELVVAARTDAPLHRELLRMRRAFDERLDAVLTAHLSPPTPPEGSHAEAPPPRAVPEHFVFTLLSGLALDRFVGHEHTVQVLEVLKAQVRRWLAPASPA